MTAPLAAPAERVAWGDALARFDTAAREADGARAQLARQAAIAARHPQMMAEHQALTARAMRIEAGLGRVRAAVADVRAALAGLWDRVRGVWSAVPTPTLGAVPALAALPLIPIAAVVAATAVLTSFVSDHVRFTRRLSLFESQIAAGRSPDEAARIVERVAPEGSLLTLGGLPLWMIAAGAVALWWMLGRRA